MSSARTSAGAFCPVSPLPVGETKWTSEPRAAESSATSAAGPCRASAVANRRPALPARLTSRFDSSSRIRVNASTTATNGTGSGTPKSARS